MWNGSSRPSSARAATTPWTWGCSSRPPLALSMGLLLLVAGLASGVGLLLPAAALGLGRCPGPRTWGGSSQPFLRRHSLALWATAPDLRRGVAPPGHHPLDMGSSWLLPLMDERRLSEKLLAFIFRMCFAHTFLCSTALPCSSSIYHIFKPSQFVILRKTG